MNLLPLIQTTGEPQETGKETIFLSPPHMTGNEMTYIEEAFTSNWVAPLGPNVNAFEEELAAYSGTAGASAVCSGTAAIHLALKLLGVGEGDVVFCSSLTFVASANPILYLGAKPVFIDSEEESWNMSPLALRNAFLHAATVGKLPKAVIIVHIYGNNADMDALMAICDEYNVPVIEDAAESLGADYKGRKSGSMGRFGVYSFNGNKIITTSGGGMLISNDKKALQQARYLSTQARDAAAYYEHSVIGYNYRMSNVLAGVGRAQLVALDDRVSARRNIFKQYKEGLSGIPGVTFQPELDGTKSNRWLTVIRLDPDVSKVSIENLMEALQAENIEARRVWKPLHQQKLFEGCLFFPHEPDGVVSERLFGEGLCLPSGSNLTPCQQKRVIGTLKQLLMT